MRLRDTNIIDRAKQEVALEDLLWDRAGHYWYTEQGHEIDPTDMKDYAAALEAKLKMLESVLINLLKVTEEYDLRIEGEWGYGRTRKEMDATAAWAPEILAARVALAAAQEEQE